jgi:hypothetical protein
MITETLMCVVRMWAWQVQGGGIYATNAPQFNIDECAFSGNEAVRSTSCTADVITILSILLIMRLILSSLICCWLCARCCFNQISDEPTNIRQNVSESNAFACMASYTCTMIRSAQN